MEAHVDRTFNWTKFLFLLILLTPGCAGRSAAPLLTADLMGLQSRQFILAEIDKDAQVIDYDTLMAVYHEIISSPVTIPDVGKLLGMLIDQRNADPRVDQMVLIFTARALGQSSYPIPEAQGLFEKILNQDSGRINHWVLSFVADAIGSYQVDLPDGDALMDRVQMLEARLNASADDEKEYFGHHFMPPPKSRTIIDHLAGIADRRARQLERNAYYTLLTDYESEDKIVAAFDYIKNRGMPGTNEVPLYPLASLVRNRHHLPEGLKP
jgi:hypothetical protein